jgi:quercetin 2,3-dioxygenase
MKNGGPLEILQLWLNLPARLKMSEPHYEGFSESQIPTASDDNGNVHVQVVSGEWNGAKGAFQTPTDCHLATLYFKPGARVSLSIPSDHTIFFYLISGTFQVNGAEVPMRHLVEFAYEGSQIDVLAQEEGILLFGHALPLKEPVVAQGPFVMNTEQEIRQAYLDYQSGKFGSWE